MSRRKRMMRRQSTRRVKIVPPAVYTVEIIRPRDARGVLIPFQVRRLWWKKKKNLRFRPLLCSPFSGLWV